MESVASFDAALPLAELTDLFDWEQTPIGAQKNWSQSLRTALSICLSSRFPIVLFWGPELVQLYNDAYSGILGARHPALGQRARECWPEIWDSIGPMLHGVMERREATWSENLLLPVERNGAPEEAYFTFSYSPVADGDGVGGVFCAVVETTATVLQEKEARKRVEALAELDRVKTEFFNNVSHEFRTPLTLILGPLDQWLRTGALTDTELAGDLMLVRRNARRLLRLVTTLLDFNRLEAQRLVVQPIALDPAAFTADVASTFRSAMDAAGLDFDVRTAAIGPVMLDPRLWETIVLNLISNALKYTLTGGVAVELTQDAGTLRLSVADTGIGVGDSQHVFDRFWRADGQLARSHEGSGIGLSLVREIVELQGGSVAFTSAPGQGSTVVVSVPVVAADSAAAGVPAPVLAELYVDEAAVWTDAPPAIEHAADGTRPRVLVIDDNADLRAYVARLLGVFYDVALAADAVDAINRINEAPPDLVLCDVMMPGIDGLTFVRRLRSQPATRALPVLLLSARVDDDAAATAIAAGADGYLTKPFVGSELIVQIERRLNQERQRRDEESRFRASAEQEHRALLAFQSAALPRELPAIPGLDFDAIYVAAQAESSVGGDWYDAFRLPDGRVVVSIGDVMGKGLEAAVTMSGVRQAIRGAAQIHPDPVSILEAADRALFSEQADRLVTAFIGILDPLTEMLSYASAGHPAPMMRCADGRVTQLEGGGVAFGLRDFETQIPTAHFVKVPAGTTLVLYTDGLTEATRDTFVGETLLREALEAGVVRAVALRDRVAPHANDDVAILVVRTAATSRPQWTVDQLDGAATIMLRTVVRTELRAAGFGPEALADAELILGELLANVVQHSGATSATVALDLDQEPVLHVLDRGPAFQFFARLPNDMLRESGRGLFVAARLARELSVTPRPDGGNHARAILARQPKAGRGG